MTATKTYRYGKIDLKGGLVTHDRPQVMTFTVRDDGDGEPEYYHTGEYKWVMVPADLISTVRWDI